MNRKVALRTTSFAGCFAALVAATTSCSVGEATSPACDPNAPPSTPGYCYSLAPCDDGRGYPKREVGCCSEYAAARYRALCGVEIDDAARCFLSACPLPGSTTPPAADCPAATPNDPCCGTPDAKDTALNYYELCITGRLGMRDAGSSVGGSGGSSGSGGAGG